MHYLQTCFEVDESSTNANLYVFWKGGCLRRVGIDDTPNHRPYWSQLWLRFGRLIACLRYPSVQLVFLMPSIHAFESWVTTQYNSMFFPGTGFKISRMKKEEPILLTAGVSLCITFTTQRNLEVKLRTIWTDGKADVERVREEKRRRKNQRRERARRRKMQVRKKVEKSRNVVFQMFSRLREVEK